MLRSAPQVSRSVEGLALGKSSRITTFETVSADKHITDKVTADLKGHSGLLIIVERIRIFWTEK